MTTTTKLGLAEAAKTLGVTIGVLRRAIRDGRLPAPAHLNATTTLSPDWLESAQKAAKESPKTLARRSKQKVPPFARYEGTSAWRKYAKRVREFAHHQAAEKAKA